MMARKDVDMTHGNILKHYQSFAAPLALGLLFQQLYNTVDAAVIGNFGSENALAAVTSTGSIVNMLIGFFMGLSSGAGVVISQYYGAGRHNKVQDTVHTAVMLTLIMGVLFTALGIGMIPLMLQLMNMPAEQKEEILLQNLKDSYRSSINYRDSRREQ